MWKRLLTTDTVGEALRQNLRACNRLKDLEELVLKTPVTSFDAETNTLALSFLGEKQSRNRAVINKLIEHAKTNKYGPEELTRFCYGVSNGKLAGEIPQFILDQIAREENLTKFTPYELCAIFVSLAALNQPNLLVCNKLGQEIVNRLQQQQQQPSAANDDEEDGFATIELTSLQEAMEDLRFSHPKLMRAIQQALGKRERN